MKDKLDFSFIQFILNKIVNAQELAQFQDQEDIDLNLVQI